MIKRYIEKLRQIEGIVFDGPAQAEEIAKIFQETAWRVVYKNGCMVLWLGEGRQIPHGSLVTTTGEVLSASELRENWAELPDQPEGMVSLTDFIAEVRSDLEKRLDQLERVTAEMADAHRRLQRAREAHAALHSALFDAPNPDQEH